MEYCPRQVLVLRIMPCDTVYKSTSLQNFTRVAEKAIRRLKMDVRRVFAHSLTRPAGLDQGSASMLPAGQPQGPAPTPSWALMIHATDNPRQTLLLRAVLRHHFNLTEGRYSKLNAGSNAVISSISAVSSKMVATAAARARGSEGGDGGGDQGGGEGVGGNVGGGEGGGAGGQSIPTALDTFVPWCS
jgi:uncharacterized membrane protein YgcG